MVELLVSMTIIVILIGVLLPSLTMIRTKAKETAQRARQTSIETALEAFKNDYGDYPASWITLGGPVTPPYVTYVGAQRLVEALVGWDLRGFHPKTAWRADGFDSTGGSFSYDPCNARLGASLNERKGLYLELANVGVFRISQLFPNAPAPPAAPASYPFVFTDVFGARKITAAIGKSEFAGTPILYYKANPANKTIDTSIAPELRTYNVLDNASLLELGAVTRDGSVGAGHPIRGGSGPQNFNLFYEFDYKGGIRNSKIPGPIPCAHRPDSYILISAGADGLYGTRDDIRNY